MSTAPPAGAAEPVEPHGPTERLSVVRLGIVVLIVVAVVGVAFTGVRRAVANAQPASEATSAVAAADSTWTQTSMIGKIFIVFGGLLTLASAARMFFA